MSDFRNRPKNNYIHEADWQQLYVLAEHWKSDLSFYNDDLKFLHHLVELIDNPFAYDSHKFRSEHEQLEDDISEFVKTFRSNRKEIFTVTDHLMDTEQFVKQVVEDK